MLLDFMIYHPGKVSLAISVFVVCLSLWISATLSEKVCEAQTKGMGFNVEWTILGGCKIEHKEGKWIPLNRYRVED